MSIWKTFWKRDRTRSTANEAKNYSFAPSTVPLQYYQGERFNNIQRLLTDSEVVYACLMTKSDAMRDPRLMVQRKRTKQGKTEYVELDDHPMRQLIARPNPLMTESDLMAAATISWDMSNPRRFYVAKTYVNGVITELWPLNPLQMQPRYNGQNKRIGWRWSDGIKTVEYDDDDLIVREAPAWYDPAPGVVALGSAYADAEHTKYVASFFTNGGIPPVFLKDTQRYLNTPQRDEIRAKWQQIYGNASNGQHSIGILDMGQELKVIGSQLKDLDNETLRSLAESRICMVFGVPPLIIYAYVGLLRATYSNLKEAWKSYWDAKMSPALRDWRLFWTWALLTEYESERDIRSSRIRLAYDMSEVAAYQDDVDAAADRTRKDYQAGIITRNEARSGRGYAVDARPETESDQYRTPQKAMQQEDTDNERSPTRDD